MLNTRSAVQERATHPAETDHRQQLLAELSVSQRRHDLAGISTFVLEGGNGPPIVLLHGPGEFAAKWLRVIPDLVRTNRVIAPDLPGHGSSETGQGPLDAGRVLAWLGELIEHTCDSPPMLVGHVLGGAIAARFASTYQDRIARLVLVDTLGLAPFRPSPRFALAMIHFMARPGEQTYTRFMHQCSHDLDDLRNGMGDRWQPYVSYTLELSRTPRVRKAVRQLMRKVGVPALAPDELARISVPVTLIWGRHDRANPLRIAEEASARYGWPLQVIEDCADDPARDRPAAFLQALRAE